MFEKLRQTIVYFRIIVDGAESLQKAAADTILDTSDIRKKKSGTCHEQFYDC